MLDDYITLKPYIKEESGVVDALILTERGQLEVKTLRLVFVQFLEGGTGYFVLIAPPHEERYIFINIAKYYTAPDGITKTATSTNTFLPFSGGLNLLEDTLYETINLKSHNISDMFYRGTGRYYLLGTLDFQYSFRINK